MKPYNFSSQIMRDLPTFQGSYHQELMKVLTQQVHDSQKFVLPEFGNLFEESHKTDWSEVQIRLPYDRMMLEFMSVDEKCAYLVTSGKYVREILATKSYEGQKFPRIYDEAHELLIVPFYRQPELEQRWLPNPALLYTSTHGEDNNGKNGKEVTFILLSEHYKFLQRTKTTEEFNKDVDTFGDWAVPGLHAVKQLCQVLQCTNITTEKNFIHPRINAKRRNLGKLPLFQYHMLVVQSSEPSNIGTGGTHQSPRFHWRRGHIRRLPTGKQTWVRPCMVGDLKQGIIAKDYAVHPRGLQTI